MPLAPSPAGSPPAAPPRAATGRGRQRYPRGFRLLKPRDYDLGARLARGDSGRGVAPGRDARSRGTADGTPVDQGSRGSRGTEGSAGPRVQGGAAPGDAARWKFRRSGRFLQVMAWQRDAAPAPAKPGPAPAAAVAADEPARLGLTVGRKLARRAVDRNSVKRILREAGRHARADLNAAAAGSRAGAIDVVFRLKAPWPRDTTRAQRAELRRALRAEADALFATLRSALSSMPAST